MKSLTKKIVLVMTLFCFLQIFICNIQVAAEPVEWSGKVATEYAGGSGIEGDPYLISNGEELAYLAQQVNEMREDTEGVYYKLTKDIVMNNTQGWKEWNEGTEGLKLWTPIGGSIQDIVACGIFDGRDYTMNAFNGNFDGNGHTISGLYCKQSAYSDAPTGLFGAIGPEGTVKNLGLEKSFIKGNFCIGAIAGINGGMIIGSHNSGTVVVEGSAGGGIAGALAAISCTEGKPYKSIPFLSTHASIEDCYNEGEIIGVDEAYGYGGIVGYIWTESIIPESFIAESFIDENDSSIDNKTIALIKNSYNTGKIKGNGGLCGGIVGDIYQSSEFGRYLELDRKPSVIIENCYNTGEICGGSLLGGIVGQLSANSEAAELKILNSYNKGMIKCSEDYNIGQGGIAGKIESNGNVIIADCYSLGDFIFEKKENSGIGGIVGVINDMEEDEASIKIKNCYFGGVIDTNNIAGTLVGGIYGGREVYEDKYENSEPAAATINIEHTYYLKNQNVNNDFDFYGHDENINLISCGYFSDFDQELIPWEGCYVAEEDKPNLITSLNNHRGESALWFEDEDDKPSVRGSTGPSIWPLRAVFDKPGDNEHFKDIEIVLRDIEGYEFYRLKQGDEILAEGEDYTIHWPDKKLIIKKEYLKSWQWAIMFLHLILLIVIQTLN